MSRILSLATVSFVFCVASFGLLPQQDAFAAKKGKKKVKKSIIAVTNHPTGDGVFCAVMEVSKKSNKKGKSKSSSKGAKKASKKKSLNKIKARQITVAVELVGEKYKAIKGALGKTLSAACEEQADDPSMVTDFSQVPSIDGAFNDNSGASLILSAESGAPALKELSITNFVPQAVLESFLNGSASLEGCNQLFSGLTAFNEAEAVFRSNQHLIETATTSRYLKNVQEVKGVELVKGSVTGAVLASAPDRDRIVEVTFEENENRGKNKRPKPRDEDGELDLEAKQPKNGNKGPRPGDEFGQPGDRPGDDGSFPGDDSGEFPEGPDGRPGEGPGGEFGEDDRGPGEGEEPEFGEDHEGPFGKLFLRIFSASSNAALGLTYRVQVLNYDPSTEELERLEEVSVSEAGLLSIRSFDGAVVRGDSSDSSDGQEVRPSFSSSLTATVTEVNGEKTLALDQPRELQVAFREGTQFSFGAKIDVLPGGKLKRASSDKFSDQGGSFQRCVVSASDFNPAQDIANIVFNAAVGREQNSFNNELAQETFTHDYSTVYDAAKGLYGPVSDSSNELINELKKSIESVDFSTVETCTSNSPIALPDDILSSMPTADIVIKISDSANSELESRCEPNREELGFDFDRDKIDRILQSAPFLCDRKFKEEDEKQQNG